MAQSESFTGLSGNSYYVDYESGLVMQLHDNDATIVSPVKVADEEFGPMAARLADLATEHNITNQAFSIDSDNFQALLEVWELQYDQYALMTENFKNNALIVLQQYYNLADILEKAFESKAASKPAKTYGPAYSASTNFSFNIWKLISDLEYAEYMVNFTRDYLIDFEEEIKEFGEKLDESSEEMDEINVGLNIIIDSHLNYIQGVYEWMDQYIEYASEDLLYEIAQDIADRVDDLKYDVDNIDDNPADYLNTWAEICLDYMQSTFENSVETTELLTKISDSLTSLYYNFAGVLFAGPKGDEVGLYYTILQNNGSLAIPSNVYCDGKEYNVTGINGNIFSGMPEGFSMTDLKLLLPATITSIGNEAFAIEGIQEVTVCSTGVPALDSNCFTETTYADAKLYVIDNLVEDYRNTSPWNRFHNILPESTSAVKEIADVNAEVHLEGSKLIVNAPAATPVNVYDADGRTLYSGYSDTIELPAKGLYIVKTANRSIKIRY